MDHSDVREHLSPKARLPSLRRGGSGTSEGPTGRGPAVCAQATGEESQLPAHATRRTAGHLGLVLCPVPGVSRLPTPVAFLLVDESSLALTRTDCLPASA